jgi:titin
MPLISSSAGLSARALGLTSGVVAGPPTINSIDIFNGLNGNRLLVYFTPGTPGSSPITNYEYSLNDGATYAPFSPLSNSSPLQIEGLTNGTTYTVKIRSLQGNQKSIASNAVSGRPVALPNPPIPQLYFNDGGGTGGGAVLIYFLTSTAGTDPIVNYQFSLDWTNPNGWRLVNSTTSPIVISNTMGYGTILVNGTSYQRFSLRAVTSSGHFSDYVTTTQTMRPVRSPGAPTISGITASSGQISIAFTAGASGTDALSTYEYSLNNGTTFTNRATGTTASPLVVTGITNSSVINGSYTVRIRSKTNQGHFSAQSNAVVAAAMPAAAPVITASSKTPTSITVTFTSAVAGSYAIDRHERSLDGTNWSTYTSGTAITGLSTSTAYTVRIRAVDVEGVAGAQSSTAVTTDAEVAPDAPTIGVTNELTTTSIRVNYTRGAQGTYAINNDERRVYYYINNGWVLHSDWTTVTSPFDVTGLPYVNFSYLVQIQSKSTTGLAGALSYVWVSTRAPVPSAPTVSFAATSASERATASLSWIAPDYATKYHVYMNNVYQKEVTGTSTTLAVSAGNTYNFNVYAGNRHTEFSGASTTKTMVTGAKDVAFVSSDTREILMAGQGTCSDANLTRLRVGFGTVPASSDTAGYISITGISHQVKMTSGPASNFTQNDSGTRKYYFFTTAANPGGWTYSCNLHLKAIPRTQITTAYQTISTPAAVSGDALTGKEFFVGIVCNTDGWNIYSGGCNEANVTGFAINTHRIYNLRVTGVTTTATTYS